MLGRNFPGCMEFRLALSQSNFLRPGLYEVGHIIMSITSRFLLKFAKYREVIILLLCTLYVRCSDFIHISFILFSNKFFK